MPSQLHFSRVAAEHVYGESRDDHVCAQCESRQQALHTYALFTQSKKARQQYLRLSTPAESGSHRNTVIVLRGGENDSVCSSDLLAPLLNNLRKGQACITTPDIRAEVAGTHVAALQ